MQKSRSLWGTFALLLPDSFGPLSGSGGFFGNRHYREMPFGLISPPMYVGCAREARGGCVVTPLLTDDRTGVSWEAPSQWGG